MVKHVGQDALDCSNQEEAIKAIQEQNKRLHGVVEFLHVGRTTRVRNPERKASALIIDVASPQQANVMIDEGLILRSVLHEVEVFHRDCTVTRCYKCHAIGHTARVCRREIKCGFCANEGHRDDS